MLDKLLYTYSYIYKSEATKATFTFYKPILALLFLLLILIPTTSSSLHQQPGIVSPSPNPLSRTRSFNMANFTAVTHLYFIFGPHRLPEYDFLDTILHSTMCTLSHLTTLHWHPFFTDANKTAFKADAVDLLRSAIVTVVVVNNNSRADCTTLSLS